jgi:tetratricopeptide (TPR) repeat protein
MAPEEFREYLCALARLQIGPELRGHLEASDIVQTTLLEAHKHSQQFRGTTDAEMRRWLGRALANNLADEGEWHRREARAAEGAGLWYAVSWHLERLDEGEILSARLYARRGQAYALTNRWAQAVPELTKALESYRTDGGLLYLRGRSYYALGQDDNALADFSEALRTPWGLREQEGAWQARIFRGLTYYRLGQMENVVADLNKVLAIKSDHGPALHGRGMAYAALGKPDRAIADLTAALQRPNAPAQTSCDLALARLLVNDAAGYRQSCAAALSHLEHIEDPSLITTLVWTCCIAPDAVSDPQQLLRSMGDTWRQNIESYVHVRAMSAAFYRAGDFNRAVGQLERVPTLRKQPAPSSWIFLAMAHHRLGHSDQAIKFFNKARDWIEQARKESQEANTGEDELSWRKLPWGERVALTVLLREAEALLKESPRPTAPKKDKPAAPNSRVPGAPQKEPIPDTTGASTEKKAELPVAKPIRNCGEHQGQATCVAHSPDGKRAISGGFDKIVRLWDVENGKELWRSYNHEHIIWTVAFSPDGRRALTGTEDKTIRLWNVETGKEACLTMKGHSGVISSVAFLPDGKRALSACWDKTIRIWDLGTGKELDRLSIGVPVLSVALTKDGRHVVLGSNDGKLRYSDLQGKKEVRAFAGPTGMVEGVALAAEGRQVVVAGADGGVHLYELDTGKEIKTLKAHEKKVDCVALSPDGTRVLSCGEDKIIRLWDLASSRELWLGQLADKIRWAAFSPDGKRAVSACYDRSVALWELPK